MQLVYELSPSDYEAAQSLFLRRKKAGLFWFGLIYGGATVLWGLVDLSRGRPLAVVLLVLGLFLMINVPILSPRGMRKLFPKSRALHGVTTLQTSSEGVSIESPNARHFYRWDVVFSVVEGPKVWLLLISPQSFIMVPTRAFASPEEMQMFRVESGRHGSFANVNVGAPIASP